MQHSLTLPSGQRPTRIALGIAGIIALALVLGWFLLQFEPAPPRKAPAPETPSVVNSLHEIVSFDTACKIVPVAVGEPLNVKGFVRGHAFTYSDDEWAELTSQLSKERVLEIIEEPDWRFELGDIDILPGTVRIVLVDVSIANRSDRLADARGLYLTSAKFKAPWEGGPAVVYPDHAALGAMYGVESAESPFKELPEEWDAVEPGETRTLTLPFVVYRNELAGPDTIDRLCAADFELLTYRCDPLVAYTMPLR